MDKQEYEKKIEGFINPETETNLIDNLKWLKINEENVPRFKPLYRYNQIKLTNWDKVYPIEIEYARTAMHIYGDHISAHAPIIYWLSSQCDICLDLGMNAGNVTRSIFFGRPKKVTSVEIKQNNFLEQAKKTLNQIAKNSEIEHNVIFGHTLLITAIESDLLCIDDNHNKSHVKKELDKYGLLCKKYIWLHDTKNCSVKEAINEWNNENNNWIKIYETDIDAGSIVLANKENVQTTKIEIL